MDQFKRLVWNPQYTVHVEELDAQHQKLFNITNHVFDMYEKGSGDLLPSLKDLVEYLCKHIKTENTVMIRCGYPDYAAQNTQHEIFIDKMQSFLKSYKEDEKDLVLSILHYLHNWIFSHTVNMDLKYGQYLISRPANGSK
jgi:hemerythrin